MSRAQHTLSPSHADASEGLPSNAPTVPKAPLVGAVGQEYVHSVLSSLDPQSALREVQRRGAFANKRCDPLLRLLDNLGVKRADAHRAVLEAAKARLLAMVARAPPEALTPLLEASFAYIGLPGLRDVPLAVLGRMRPVPAAFLKQLATDAELFHDLPHSVQQEVWELDRKLLQQHALPLVEGYTWETGTLLRALDMDEFLPAQAAATGAEAKLGGPRVARRIQRSGSPALKKLVAMVGRSAPIFRGVVELCAVRLRDSEAPYLGVKEAAYCSLRSQLLMALHDGGANEITSKDPVHKLAWTLDACLKDRVLDSRRLRELTQFLAAFDRQAATAQGRQAAPAKKRRRDSLSGAAGAHDAESMGAPGRSSTAGEAGARPLADAGMVLRDPSTMHLIIHHILRRLEGVVEASAQPADEPDLVFLTRLLQLACSCRAQLRARRYSFPAADPELLRGYYPLLTAIILEVQMRDEDEDGEMEIDANLVAQLSKDEVVRHITQVFCLERLAAKDLITATSVLGAMVQALERMSDKALPEWAPFAATLAQRLAKLVGSGHLGPDQVLWTLAVDQFLLRAVDTEGQVHEEVLRLLMVAIDCIGVPKLAEYLQATLANSKKSRRRTKRRHAEAEGLEETAAMAGYEAAYGGYFSEGPSGFYTAGALSDGRVLEKARRLKTQGDGVKYLYQDFVRHAPGLTQDTAPQLMEYLSSG